MDFEEQFEKRHQVAINGKNIYFVDVIPNKAADVPIFLARGWGETPKTFNKS